MKGLLLAVACSLVCALATTLLFRTVAVRARAAAMLRIFLFTVPLYLAAYALTPADLSVLPEALVEPRAWLGGALGLYVHAALFFGGWLQLYNLADRGFSLHILIAIDRSPAGALSPEELRERYGDGGIAGMADKRIAGILETGFVTLDGGRLRPTSKGIRAARLFEALRAFLQIDTPQ
ncbi:MAG TPA: hypothetical protein VFO18_18030 [Methylomirabilota bacterium]|nr:hypothetical protein [Methylomirabilota bacterium]